MSALTGYAKRLARSASRGMVSVARAVVPQPNPVSVALGNLTLAQLSIKNLGYELGRSIAKSTLAGSTAPIAAPIHAGLGSQPTRQADIESPWLWYWCQQLKTSVIYHRKIWELGYLLQVLWENGMLQPGRRGLGFGCGNEPIASLLTALGVDVTITDQPIASAQKSGWAASGHGFGGADQYTSSLDAAFHADLVDRATFEQRARLEYVDMNAIDPVLRGYDFCWSVCAFEHLGSIKQGQDFVVNAMKTLKPGGIGVHTTEFNLNNDGSTHEGVSLVLFQQRHIEDIAARLRTAGDELADMDFDSGSGPIDTFVDLPPYSFEAHEYLRSLTLLDSDRVAHLKLAIGGFPSTCYGLWARRGGPAQHSSFDRDNAND